MAIIKNVVMRGASQKLGGVVFYTRKGETVARELAPSVSNPRTWEQMKQRVRLSNVVNAYKANKSWIDGAFEDKLAKETDYNAFVRFNLTDSKVALSKGASAAGSAVVSPYKISSGSLPEISNTRQTTGVVSDLYTGNTIITQATTVAQLSAALISNNNGIVHGMQLSLIVNVQRMNESTNRPYIVVRAYEMIINETDTTLLSEYFPLGILETLDTDGRPLFFNGTTIGDGAAAFILSITEGGRTRVSTQSLVLYGNQSIYTIYTSPLAVADAIASYGTNAERFLSSDEANKHNPVTLLNYIQAVSYNGRLYSSGDNIRAVWSSVASFYFFFAQAVGDNPTITLYYNGDEYVMQGSDIGWAFGHTRLEIIFPEALRINENAECLLLVEDGENQMQFDFNIVVE